MSRNCRICTVSELKQEQHDYCFNCFRFISNFPSNKHTNREIEKCVIQLCADICNNLTNINIDQYVPNDLNDVTSNCSNISERYAKLKYRHTKKLGFKSKTFITHEQFCKLIGHGYNPCFYCGKSNSSGIDRLNNHAGYTIENVVSCCSDCNYMKGTMSKYQFIDHVRLICKHNKHN